MSAVPDPWALLARGVTALAEPTDPRLEARARAFLAELRQWNRMSRLTGYRDEADQIQHLIVESLLLLRVLAPAASPLLDIGTGAGVPGLILKCARPEWEVVLIEAKRRRANFLRHAIRCLELEGMAVYEGRAEALAASPMLAGRFRTVTMRAVAAPGVALGLARPFLRSDGRLVLPLSPGARGGPGTVREVSLPGGSGRLPLERAFRIIGAAEGGSDVPRGTSRAGGVHPGGSESEGGRGKDHDCR